MNSNTQIEADRSQPGRMQCMEVWGGNREADNWLEMPGLDVRVYSRPHGGASGGGDVYYISSCASGRITRMLLADVSGHGQIVSDQALGLLGLMRKNVNFIKQTRFVRAMNRQFSEFGKLGGFATALVVTFFAPTHTLSISNAGHPHPLFFCRSTGEWSFILQELPDVETVTDTPLGIVEQAHYGTQETRLHEGDLVICYSDALIEAHTPDGELQGTQGLLEIVQQTNPQRPEEVIPTILDALKKQHADNLTEDDVTILLFQATRSRTTLKNNLLAPFRFFGHVADHTSLEFPT